MSAPRPPLFTDEQRARLLANGAATLADPSHDPWPVVKLFTPDAGATWLVTEIDPEEPNRLWALCDLGLGFAEYGTVWLSEIEELRGHLGLPVERDRQAQRRTVGLALRRHAMRRAQPPASPQGRANCSAARRRCSRI
jgi:hypothetical protein